MYFLVIELKPKWLRIYKYIYSINSINSQGLGSDLASGSGLRTQASINSIDSINSQGLGSDLASGSGLRPKTSTKRKLDCF